MTIFGERARISEVDTVLHSFVFEFVNDLSLLAWDAARKHFNRNRKFVAAKENELLELMKGSCATVCFPP